MIKKNFDIQASFNEPIKEFEIINRWLNTKSIQTDIVKILIPQLPSIQEKITMDKEEQKKLLIEMMEADEKDGLYDPVVSKVETTQTVKVLLHDACIKFLKENGNILYKDDKVYYQFPSCWYKVTNEENVFEEFQGSPDTSPNTQNK